MKVWMSVCAVVMVVTVCMGMTGCKESEPETGGAVVEEPSTPDPAAAKPKDHPAH